MERIHSLRDIADSVGREKRTVQNWYAKHKDETGQDLGEIGSDNTRRFSDEERQILLTYGTPAREKVEFVSAEPVVAGEIVEFEGVRFNPSLAASRFDGHVGKMIENPEQAVEILTLLCGSVIGKLEAKQRQQKEAIAQTRKAQYQVEGQLEVFTEKATKLGIKTKALAEEQTASTEELEGKLAEIMEMGQSS